MVPPPGLLWDELPDKTEVHGLVAIDLFADPYSGKPVLCLKSGNTVLCYLTANIAEMIGGAAKGATARWEDYY